MSAVPVERVRAGSRWPRPPASGPDPLNGHRAHGVEPRANWGLGGTGETQNGPGKPIPPFRKSLLVVLRRTGQSSRSAALRAATSTGSHTGENGGAYDRSRLAT